MCRIGNPNFPALYSKKFLGYSVCIICHNKRIITMEWIVEGLTLCFVGSLVLFITIPVGSQDRVSSIVYWLCGMMLIIMAILSTCKDYCGNIVFPRERIMNRRWEITVCEHRSRPRLSKPHLPSIPFLQSLRPIYF